MYGLNSLFAARFILTADGLNRQAAEPRQPGSRSNGGQPGHVGITRAWTETPDAAREISPLGTCGCGLSLADQPGRLGERRQQIEIPEPKAEVIEYRQRIVTCACGCVHRGVFPFGVTPHVSYGPRLKAYAVALVDGHFVALGRTAEILADQYGVRPSDGTLQNWVGQAAGILPKFMGYAVHDPWAPYFHFTQVTHSLCSAHLLRELRYFEEAPRGHRWPVRLREILVDGKKAVEAARAEGRSAVDTATRDRLLADYDRWVTLGLSIFPERPKAPGQKGGPK